MKEIAIRFGVSLDNDDFDVTKGLLSLDCKYIIDKDVLIGPENICRSYEQNMIKGRKKLDKLEWGQSRVESISNSEYFVHFTDFLTHKGVSYTHKCEQKITINAQEKITLIEHMDNPDEQRRLDAFYKKVGLKQ